MNYYGNILVILEQKNISQYQMAKMLGVPRSTFNRWIKGTYEPPLEIILKTAEILDISIDEEIFKRNNKKAPYNK